MDKKTIIGLVLMVAVFIGYTFYMSSEREKKDEVTNNKTTTEQTEAKEAMQESITPEMKNSLELKHHGTQNLVDRYMKGDSIIERENDFIKVAFNPLGGKIEGVVLKNYTRYGSDECVSLIKPGSAQFGIDLYHDDVDSNTTNYLFDCDAKELENGDVVVTMTLPIKDAETTTINNDDGTTSEVTTEATFIEYIYTLHNTGNASEDYLIDFAIKQKNIAKYLYRSDEIILRWGNKTLSNEKSFTNENTASTIVFYSHEDEESDEIGSSGEREHHRDLDWIALKQQYFTSALIAEDVIHAGLGFTSGEEKSGYVKDFNTRIIIPYSGQTSYNFAFYYGPNDYNIMKDVKFDGQDSNLEEIIPMGGWLIGWLNRILTIPVFNWLKDHGLSFGLIILILTIIVKLIILPLTYKSYMSTAKMRAIRPEMEEINQKYPKQEDAMKKQQALMELYRKAGVSPMGGCLPLLIQMPILWAMFRFFPASIELRGESFLWADDLSSYDSILDLPFSIPFYGNHVSLFALLMAVSLFGYSYMSYKQQAATTSGQPGANVMKFMMVYFMPVMMLFFFNGYSSGLCYYYFLSQMLTMLIMFIIRRSVDDEKVRARLLANAAKPRKKSRFQERYEEMLKQQQEQLNREQRRQRK